METVSLMTCADNALASIIQGHLQNEGIPCFLTNQNYTALYPNYSRAIGTGVQIMVRDSDYVRAVKIVKETYPEIYGEIEAVVVCPNCKSSRVKVGLKGKVFIKYVFFLLSVFMLYPVGKVETIYTCKNCNTKFE